LLLALFGLLGQTNLNAMNGIKNLVSALLTAIAVAVYAWGGLVAWPQALVMMIAATAGGYLGARLARRISRAHAACRYRCHRFAHDHCCSFFAVNDHGRRGIGTAKTHGLSALSTPWVLAASRLPFANPARIDRA
jgi:hypothetical protein